MGMAHHAPFIFAERRTSCDRTGIRRPHLGNRRTVPFVDGDNSRRDTLGAGASRNGVAWRATELLCQRGVGRTEAGMFSRKNSTIVGTNGSNDRSNLRDRFDP